MRPGGRDGWSCAVWGCNSGCSLARLARPGANGFHPSGMASPDFQLLTERERVKLRLRNLRSSDIVRGLHEGRLDFGLVRRDSLTRPLAGSPLGVLDYALFVPRKLLPGGRKRDFAWVVAARGDFGE